ncbi:pentatricopeptide repeat-containing protein At3g62890-like [Typha angustifolia]|uniref:pentatricopeptide repeat-containing protein At3g62890-like n=1 Tax=Typha angustifolia TaxID=59011 RepID=UPI003C2FEC02
MPFTHTLSKRLPWQTPSSLKRSAQLHAQMVVSGALLHPPSMTHLLKSIADSSEPGALSYALKLFDEMPSPSTFIWNTVIRVCYRVHAPEESIRLYHRMHRNSVGPDAYTFHFLFKSCSISLSKVEGLMVQGVFTKLFPESDGLIMNSLIHMYMEFGLVDDARRAFDQVKEKDVVSWTTIVSGLAKFGFLNEAKELFDRMPARNVVSWTSLIAGFCRAGQAAEAVNFFNKMLSDNVAPDVVTMVVVLSSCAELKDLELGRRIHGLVKDEMAISNNLVVALVDMYSKCGDIKAAHEVFLSMGAKIPQAWNAIIDGYCKIGDVDVARSLFDQMQVHDVISFNSMITGYIHCGKLKEALFLFAELRSSHMRPDNFTIVGLLTACASLGALAQGKALHACVEERLVEWDVYLGTSLLDMYMKCGKVDEAMLVFRRMDEKDVRTWTATIAGLALNGMGDLALEHFSLMKKDDIRPNAVAYLSVLTACSHAGRLEDSQMYFEEMRSLYKLQPEIEHYGCMIDLLGRTGRLKEAMELIHTMPMEPNAVIWGSILSACRMHKEISLAENAAEHLLRLEPHEDAVYVQLYNIYVDSRRWADASKIRGLMEQRGVRKTAGYSSIAVAGQIHKFIAGDQSHPRIMEIKAMMDEIAKRLKSAGYSPIVSQITVDVDEEEKEHALFAHSEKMAIAFGIMTMASNLPIHVLKNLRVCEDCHSAIKWISKIWNRDIVVRDRSRFHHFQDGRCSCNDFW